MKSVCCRAQKHEPLNSYAESFAHPEIQKLRTDLLTGIKNPICNVCWKDEELGMTSTRQLSIQDKTIEDMQIEVDKPDLKWLWLDPGNYCNFACRTCFSEFSTRIGLEQSQRFNNSQLLMVRKPDLTIMSNQDFSSIETVMILGGEPFLNLDHLDIVDSIIKQKTTKTFTIIYVTNNSKRIPDKLVDYLRRYPDIHIIVVISIDAIGEPFNYIRTKGDWDEFVQNFQYLQELGTQGLNISINANITISVLNVLYLDNLYTWLEDNGVESSKITTSFVEGCPQYSFQILNQSQKQQIIERLMHSKNNLQNVIQAINNSAFDSALTDKFWQDVDWVCNHYDLDIYQYLPDLTDIISVQKSVHGNPDM